MDPRIGREQQVSSPGWARARLRRESQLVALATAWLFSIGCGETRRSAGSALAGATAVAGTGGSASQSGGSGTVGGDEQAGDSGQAGAPPVGNCDVAAADPTLTARYRWKECGRIQPTTLPLHALYAKDGSILVLEATGRITAYPPGGSSSTALAGTALSEGQSGANWGSMLLSRDGGTLMFSFDSKAYVYRSSTREPIGRDSGALELVKTFDVGAAGCGQLSQFSLDGALAMSQDGQRVCVWDVEQGVMRADIALTGSSVWPAVVGSGAGSAPVLVFWNGAISSYAASGELEATNPVEVLQADGSPPSAAAFSTDGTVLLVGLAQSRLLVGVDARTGKERWQRPMGREYPTFVWSDDGEVTVLGDRAYRSEDGSPSGPAIPELSYWHVTASSGPKLLLVGEQVVEWDVANGRFSQVYGSHAEAVQSLDISRDGRYLASKAGAGTVWDIGANFSEAKAIFSSPRVTDWHIALSPRADAMILSGDPVLYFGLDGTCKGNDHPPPLSLNCVTGRWAFSPDGTRAAGTWYAPAIQIRDVPSFQGVAGLAAENCSGGVAYSPDGSRLVTADLKMFDTATQQLLWSRSPPAQGGFVVVGNAVAFAPNCSEVVRTICSGDATLCTSERHDARTGELIGTMPGFEGREVRYSPEGHWLVSKGQLLHLPSGTKLDYAAQAKVALFTAQGDIIAGQADGALVHYCRSSE